MEGSGRIERLTVAGATGFQPALGTSRDHSPKRAGELNTNPEGFAGIQSPLLDRQLALCTRPRTRTLRGWFWRPARNPVRRAKVEPPGVAPGSPPCRGGVFLLDDGPEVEAAGVAPASHPCEGWILLLNYAPRSGPCGDRTRRESLAKRLCALATRPVVGVTGIGPAYTCAQDRWVTTTLHPVGVSDRSRTGLAQVHSLRAPLFALAHRNCSATSIRTRTLWVKAKDASVTLSRIDSFPRLGSNKDRLSQNQPCCQLHHKGVRQEHVGGLGV